jgi:hypothetical protein
MSVWLKDLNKVLKKAGVPVIQEKYTRGPYSGKTWKTVGFNGQGYRDFKFVLWHHDASPQGDSPGALDWMKYMEIAPAGAIWVCSGCNGKHASGTWHLIAAGLSNHAGTGGNDPKRRGNTWGVPVDGMNAVALGIETDHTYGERWTGPKKQAQLNSLRRGTAAIMLAYDLNPKPGLMRHLDWTNGLIDGNGKFVTYGRKNDVDGLDLADERRRVKRIMAALGAAEDPAKVNIEEAMAKPPRRILSRWFRRADAEA